MVGGVGGIPGQGPSPIDDHGPQGQESTAKSFDQVIKEKGLDATNGGKQTLSSTASSSGSPPGLKAYAKPFYDVIKGHGKSPEEEVNYANKIGKSFFMNMMNMTKSVSDSALQRQKEADRQAYGN